MKRKMGVLAGKTTKDLELLQRHLAMLKCVAENEPVGIIKLAEILKLPQHKVRYSLRLIEQDGLIEATTSGAKTTNKLKPFITELKGQLGKMSLSIKNIERLLKGLEKI